MGMPTSRRAREPHLPNTAPPGTGWVVAGAAERSPRTSVLRPVRLVGKAAGTATGLALQLVRILVDGARAGPQAMSTGWIGERGGPVPRLRVPGDGPSGRRGTQRA